jgi:predicted PurR-regulated permease PerM
MTKQVLIVGAAVMTTLLAVFMLWQFRIVVVYVFVSLALAAVLRPLVKRLVDGTSLARAGWWAVYLAILTGFGLFAFFASGTVIAEIQQLARTVSVQDAWRLPGWLQGSSFQQSLVSRLPPPSKLFEAITGDQGQLVLPAILGLSQGIGGAVSDTIVILLMSVYWSINHIHFERLWLSLLPSGQRKQARAIWRTIELDLGAYIRSEVVQSILAVILLGLGYWLLGSPYAALLALIGALAWLIPVVGAALAVILPLLIGMLTGVQLSLVTAAYTLIVLIALQVWVEPRIFRRKWDNPILTLVILLAMADAFGILGILVAPPLSAVCQILWNLLFSQRAVSGARLDVLQLKERQARAWDLVRAMNEPPLALVTSGMARLTELIEKAEPILQAGPPGEPLNPPNPPEPASIEEINLEYA